VILGRHQCTDGDALGLNDGLDFCIFLECDLVNLCVRAKGTLPSDWHKVIDMPERIHAAKESICPKLLFYEKGALPLMLEKSTSTQSIIFSFVASARPPVVILVSHLHQLIAERLAVLQANRPDYC